MSDFPPTHSARFAPSAPIASANRSPTGGRTTVAVAASELPVRSGSGRAAVAKRVVRGLVRLPAVALLGLIRIYQLTLSPVLPVVFGATACGCRFYPTCSHYAAEAVRTHGAFAGIWLAAWRLLRCQPLHPGGFDPVPVQLARLSGGGPGAWRFGFTRGAGAAPTISRVRPRCVAVSAARVST